MIEYLIYLLAAIFIAFYLLWILYLAVMNLKRVRDTVGLPKPVFILGLPLLKTGLVLDFLLNVFVMSVILLEFPREMTVSRRLKRHNKAGGWRAKIVRKIFEPLLDPFDPSGNHI